MAEQYAIKMLEEGNIRLGTLYEYRDHWNDQVKDTDEGKFSESQKDKNVTLREGDEHGLLSEMFQAKDGAVLEFHNMHVQRDSTVPDNNIYCTTLEASEEVMRQFECDACIEIFDFRGFRDAIIQTLRKYNHPIMMHVTANCIYEGRNVDYNSIINPDRIPLGYWLKSPFYAPQKEIRTVFVSLDQKGVKSPIIINVPEIKQFIRRHNFGKN